MVAEKINNTDQIAMSLDHLSAVYRHKNNMQQHSASPKIWISLKSNNRYMTMVNYSNLGSLYSNLHRTKRMPDAFNKALIMFEEDGDLDGVQSVLSSA